VNDAAANIKIRADRMDNEMNGFATGLSNCITKDGQTTVTANIPMAGFKFTNIANGSVRTEYPSLGQVQDNVINWVAAGGTSDAITATFSPSITTLVDGQLCYVRASAANTTTTPTFSPNGLTARTIVKNGGQALLVGDIRAANQELILKYNLANTRWELLNPFISLTDIVTNNIQASSSSGVVIRNNSAADILTMGASGGIASTFAGALTVTGTTNLTGVLNVAGTSSSPAYITLAEDTDNGTNKATIIAPASISSDYTLTLPDGSGTLARTTDLTLPSGCSLYQTTGTTLTGSTWTTVGFDTENYDDDTWHDNSTNNSRITVNFTGRICLSGVIDFGIAAGSAVFGLRLLKNVTVIRKFFDCTWTTNGTGNLTLPFVGDFACTSGDYFEVQGYTNAASPVTGTGTDKTTFEAKRIK
jgi:hypothetical protein